MSLRRHVSGRTFSVVSGSPSLDEITFYFRQALEVCYRSNGKQLPEEFLLWIKRKITIDYSKLPKDIQE
jgi:hypothetical protein